MMTPCPAMTRDDADDALLLQWPGDRRGQVFIPQTSGVS